MRKLPTLEAATVASLLVWAHTVHAHGIAGNRYFDGTLGFDNPAVADEAILPLYNQLNFPTQGSNVGDNRINWAFARLLTPTLAFTADSGWIHQNWPIGHTSGADKADIGLKYEAYRDNRHETLVSVGLAWGIGHSGARGVGADAPNTIQPAVFFGKGFGDLPDSLSWLRPFAVTGAVSVEIPTSGTSTALVNSVPGELTPAVLRTDTIMHWGLSLQYSTFYLTPRYTGRLPREEPLDQFIPLVEFAFDSPMRSKPAATMNPGLAYVGDKYQVAMEAIVPLNNAAGRSAGVRAQLLLFTDDLIPSLFGQPVFGR